MLTENSWYPRKIIKMLLNGKRLFFLITIFILTWQIAQAQVLQKHINLQVKNQSVCEILKTIEKQANVHFVFVSGTINCQQKLTLSAGNKSIQAVLSQMFDNSSISFKASENNIVLTPAKKPKAKDLDVPIKQAVLKPSTQAIPVYPTSVAPIVAPVIIEQEKPTQEQRIDTPLVNLKKDTVQVSKPVFKDTLIAETKDSEPIKSKPKTKKRAVANPTPMWLSNFAVGVWGTYSFVHESFGKSPSAQSLAGHIKDSEGNSTVWDAGLTVKYRLKSFDVELGAGLQQRTWTTDIQSVMNDKMFLQILASSAYKSQQGLNAGAPQQGIDAGEPFTPVDLEPVELTVKNAVISDSEEAFTNAIGASSENKLMYLTVPIQLSYVKPLSNLFALRAGLGTDLNFLLYSKGYTLSSGGFARLSSVVNPFYLTGKLFVGADWNISKHQVLSLTAGVNLPLSSIYQSDYPTERKMLSFPIKLSYYWKF